MKLTPQQIDAIVGAWKRHVITANNEGQQIPDQWTEMKSVLSTINLPATRISDVEIEAILLSEYDAYEFKRTMGEVHLISHFLRAWYDRELGK